MTARLLLFLRMMLATVWLYNGLILKLITPDREHLQVMEAVGGLGPLSPVQTLQLIGLCETVLALGTLSGIRYRFVCWFQFFLVVAMNLIGVGSGGVNDGIKLLMTNVPLLFCMIIAARGGPGSWAGDD